MKCKGCNKEKRLVNSFFSLCKECNNIRLHGSKFGKSYTKIKGKKKSGTSKEKLKYVVDKGTGPIKRKIDTGKVKKKKSRISERTIEKIRKDEEFYEKCFNMSNHRCEECGKPLPKEFRNSEGRVIARYRYSHIIPKSIAPELRHEVKNINHLCLHHHEEWENGDRRKMKIYEKNKKRLPQYF